MPGGLSGSQVTQGRECLELDEVRVGVQAVELIERLGQRVLQPELDRAAAVRVAAPASAASPHQTGTVVRSQATRPVA